jgi:hypothetical protein
VRCVFHIDPFDPVFVEVFTCDLTLSISTLWTNIVDGVLAARKVERCAGGCSHLKFENTICTLIPPE